MIIRPVSCSKPGGGLSYKNDGDAGRKRLNPFKNPCMGGTKILWEWLEFFFHH